MADDVNPNDQSMYSELDAKAFEKAKEHHQKVKEAAEKREQDLKSGKKLL